MPRHGHWCGSTARAPAPQVLECLATRLHCTRLPISGAPAKRPYKIGARLKLKASSHIVPFGSRLFYWATRTSCVRASLSRLALCSCQLKSTAPRNNRCDSTGLANNTHCGKQTQSRRHSFWCSLTRSQPIISRRSKSLSLFRRARVFSLSPISRKSRRLFSDIAALLRASFN